MLIIGISIANPVVAQGEHSRRAAAELQVIIGDVRKLGSVLDLANTTPYAKGLVQRINGGFSTLDILFRLADQETDQPPQNYSTDLTAARKLLSLSRLAGLEEKLTHLQEQFPLQLPAITVGVRDIGQALDMHEEMCSACHDNPIENVERPAYNLYEQAEIESELEFFARMLIGVRGDRVTGIDNPFSDLQLMSLISLYVQGKP